MAHNAPRPKKPQPLGDVFVDELAARAATLEDLLDNRAFVLQHRLDRIFTLVTQIVDELDGKDEADALYALIEQRKP